ncbi:dihydrofolate reductase [Angustibacter aerolatus]
MPSDAGPVTLVWAQASGGLIGRDGGMPWRVPEDMAHFVELTTGTTVVMGRATWQSIPPRFRPLADRRNLVLSRSGLVAEGAEVLGSLDAALAAAQGPVSVVGGGRVYAEALPLADAVELTELDLDLGDQPDDVHAPLLDGWLRVREDDWRTSRTGVRYRFVRLERPGVRPAARP